MIRRLPKGHSTWLPLDPLQVVLVRARSLCTGGESQLHSRLRLSLLGRRPGGLPKYPLGGVDVVADCRRILGDHVVTRTVEQRLADATGEAAT